MRYPRRKLIPLVAVLGLTAGCATIKKNTKEEAHEYRTIDGQVVGGSVTWPAAGSKEIKEKELKPATDRP